MAAGRQDPVGRHHLVEVPGLEGRRRVSYADYMHCPGCDGKTIYMGDRDDPDPPVAAWHVACLNSHWAGLLSAALATSPEPDGLEPRYEPESTKWGGE